MACEIMAEINGADIRLSIRKTGCEIHVRFRNSMETQAKPQPIMNQATHFPMSDFGHSFGKSQSIGE